MTNASEYRTNSDVALISQKGVATNWKIREPAPELSDPISHTETEHFVTPNSWHLVGASRRGKLHAHQARFRDDAFALAKTGQWQILVVADGGGSKLLARVGSKVASQVAIKAMLEQVNRASPDMPATELADIALREGMKQAWEAVAQKAQNRNVTMRELGTTYLSVMHRPFKGGSLIGVLQVGDGLIAAKVNDSIITLAKPDSGESAGSTLFLNSLHWKNWIDRASVGTLNNPIRLLAAMTDGISDDFTPHGTYLPKLFDYLYAITQQETPAKALLTMMGYDKHGSFDDRTIAMLYHRRSSSQLVKQMMGD